MTSEAGGVEKRFLEDFGSVVRWNGSLGVRLVSCQTQARVSNLESLPERSVRLQVDCLWIADPKAINHVLQKSGYLYAKPSDIRERLALSADHGLLWAGGGLSIATTPSLLSAHLTIPQATYTSATGGQWPLRLVSLRPKVCYRISWILLIRHTSFTCIWSRMLTRAPVIRWGTSGMGYSRTASPGIQSLST